MRIAELDRFEARSAHLFLRLFGVSLLVNVATEIHTGVWQVHTGALYPWRHIPIVPLYPAPVLALEWALTVLAGALLVARRHVVVATRLAAIATLSAVLQRYSNHGVLLFLVALFLSFDPSVPETGTFVRPNLGLVRAQLVIVYVFSALNKMLHGFSSGASIANLLHLPLAWARPMAVGALVAELALPILLFVRPRLGIAGVVALHAVFAVAVPGTTSFALVMIAMAVLFETYVRGRKFRPIEAAAGAVERDTF